MRFQSALPRGERHQEGGKYQWVDLISIRAPARGATGKMRIKHIFLQFQSALPRGERPIAFTPMLYPLRFQSALPRGERRDRKDQCFHKTDFNPRSREGGDDESLEDYVNAMLEISIRAPARGATYAVDLSVGSFLFQSALPRGERLSNH